jgi:uncharacterized protein YcgI (DUF1989 family)
MTSGSPPDGSARYPFDHEFYDRLVAARSSFTLVSEHLVEPPKTGWGFRVEAGQAFRIVTVSEPQITDVCILNADDPREHYAAGTQLAIEGSWVTRKTRVWGTAPRSRPLCTCIADTVKQVDVARNVRHHVVYSAHCNPHHWTLYSGQHPRTCYDNLRSGMALMGFSQRHIHDNLNLFQKSGLDPLTGHFLVEGSETEAGDYVEFFAEVNLVVVMSLCPYGGGAVEPDDWAGADIPVFPLAVRIYDTPATPLGWPELVEVA